MKKCNVCSLEKDLSQFYKVSKSKQHYGAGHEARCKDCTKAHQSTPEYKERANAAARARRATPEGKEHERKKRQLYMSRHPEAKARNAERVAEWVSKNPDRYKEIQRKSAAKYSKTEGYTKALEKYRAVNKHKRSAQSKLQAAIKSGKVLKPFHCELCLLNTTLEGHHPDYTKPLAVIWLCKPCHEAVHHEV